MINNNPPDTSRKQGMTDIFKSWMMVALTLIFVVLYTAALLGWLKPLTDLTMISRLEPIIFVIIGYYFGRLPAQQNEKTLKDEISRQTQKADAAQHAKEQAQQVRETLEEKVKNARTALVSNTVRSFSDLATTGKDNNSMTSGKNEVAQHSIETAVNILDS